VHTVPIPRLGGTAMLLGFAVALLTASRMPFLDRSFTDTGAPWGVLLGAAAVCALGVADDLWQLDAVTKLAGQSIAGGLMAWKGVQLVSLPVAGVTILSTGVLVGLTVIAVVVTINAVNFVDGLDGLAAGMIAIAGSALFVYSYLLSKDANPGDYSSLATLMAAALVGCCLGFLPHNFNPARIFMGDSGSMLIGLLFASSTIAITGRSIPRWCRGRTSCRRSSRCCRSCCRSPCSPSRWWTCCWRSCGGPGPGGRRGTPTRCTCTTGCSRSATATRAPC
jgi:UDP-GlcNAc:undecaprenyl-phosphate GlcNAc-1-phosphate transferase